MIRRLLRPYNLQSPMTPVFYLGLRAQSRAACVLSSSWVFLEREIIFFCSVTGFEFFSSLSAHLWSTVCQAPLCLLCLYFWVVRSHKRDGVASALREIQTSVSSACQSGCRPPLGLKSSCHSPTASGRGKTVVGPGRPVVWVGSFNSPIRCHLKPSGGGEVIGSDLPSTCVTTRIL